MRHLTKMGSYQDSFLEVYMKWAIQNHTYGKFDEFEQYLKRLFFESVKDFKLKEVQDISVADDLLDSYMERKRGAIREENAKYDIKNVEYIKKRRKTSGNNVGWNTNEYLISADQKLIDWVQIKATSENPIVVLPSVWYSIILKVTGRITNDDEKAFSEFIRMRYIQSGNIENVKYIIEAVCKKTNDGVLQDMLFEEICENNEYYTVSDKADEPSIDKKVDKAYENVLANQKKINVEEGRKLGEKSGYADGMLVGEKIGKLKHQRDSLKLEIAEKSKVKRIKNLVINIAICVGMMAIVFAVYKFLPENIKQQASVAIKGASYVIPTGIVFALSNQFFPIELEKVKKIEENNAEGKLTEINSALDNLERETSNK